MFEGLSPVPTCTFWCDTRDSLPCEVCSKTYVFCPDQGGHCALWPRPVFVEFLAFLDALGPCCWEGLALLGLLSLGGCLGPFLLPFLL
jgi:hypothetical protein